jgi:hypothetical protein
MPRDTRRKMVRGGRGRPVSPGMAAPFPRVSRWSPRRTASCPASTGFPKDGTDPPSPKLASPMRSAGANAGATNHGRFETDLLSIIYPFSMAGTSSAILAGNGWFLLLRGVDQSPGRLGGSASGRSGRRNSPLVSLTWRGTMVSGPGRGAARSTSWRMAPSTLCPKLVTRPDPMPPIMRLRYIRGGLKTLMFRFAGVSTKHPGFVEEREWRLIHSPQIEGVEKHVLRPCIRTIRGIRVSH